MSLYTHTRSKTHAFGIDSFWKACFCELFHRETHGAASTTDTHGEVPMNELNKESDAETQRYASLEVNNPTYDHKQGDDGETIYENP